MYKLRDLNGSSETNSTHHLSPLQLGFTSYLCVTSLVPSTFVLVLNAFIGHKYVKFYYILNLIIDSLIYIKTNLGFHSDYG